MARLVDRDERRGAGGVECERGALKVEQVGDPPRGGAADVPGPDPGIDLFRLALLQKLAVIGRADAEEHPCVGPRERGRSNPGVLKGLDGGL